MIFSYIFTGIFICAAILGSLIGIYVYRLRSKLDRTEYRFAIIAMTVFVGLFIFLAYQTFTSAR